MQMLKRVVLAVVVQAVMVGGAVAVFAGERQAPAPTVALSDAGPNTWVRIALSPTGWRDQPIFVYAANLKRFVMAAGYQAYGGVVPRHYDTEEFDLSAAKWINAYPASVAAGRPESGPVGEAYSMQREKQGYNGFELFYKDGEHLRVGAGGQWLETRGYHESCWVPATGRIYAYLHDKTLCYDPTSRAWQDLKASPRMSCRIWGAMCFDPVNREIVHAGGDGGSDEIGTWVYSIEKNDWRKLECGSIRLKQAHAQASSLRWQAKALLGAVCNRFAVSETAGEAAADLKGKAGQLALAAERLMAGIRSAGLVESDPAAGHVALSRLEAAVAAVQALAPKLGATITPEIIGELRAARVIFEQVAAALAPEPTGRARSPIAFDPEHKKIVLFGGDELDRVLSDTWVYDCATRTWEQRFPKVCPLPRAGHVLAWLPKAKTIVLAGGYSREWLAQEVWTYDVAADLWKPLLHVPLVEEGYERQKYSQNCPRVDGRGIQVGAVNEDDVLVCLGREKPGLVTWACKVDPSHPAESAARAVAGQSGRYTFNRIDPSDWEKAAQPDAKRTRAFLEALPPNEWTAMKFARYAPGATNRWGTTAYDADRHQFLFWGGGHATSQENDVAHFSVQGGCWTLGYHPDDPIERVYASQPTPVSFNDRPHVPVHAYKAYCYDPSAGRMLYLDRAYDPATREWQPGAYPGLVHAGVMHSHIEPTPMGAVTYSAKGLFRFDAKGGRWVKLAWIGPSPERIWCDGDSLVYDSKRDCLWLANDKDVHRYDLATGRAEKATPAKPKALGKFFFWGEEAYVPEADLVLIMHLFARPDGRSGSAAWDPADGRFYWVDLKFIENGKAAQLKHDAFSWHDAIAYDPTLKLVLLNNSSARKVWAMRFDRKSVRMEAMD